MHQLGMLIEGSESLYVSHLILSQQKSNNVMIIRIMILSMDGVSPGIAEDLMC